MTEEQHELDEENKPSKSSPDVTGTDEIDVESALAAISSLHDLVPADELVAPEAADEEPFIVADEADEGVAIAEPVSNTVDDGSEYADYAEVETVYSDFPRPPHSVLHRGQLASIIPAALLIGAGALMTITLTTSADATLNVPLVSSLAVSGLGLALVTHWFSSARWTTGSFFVGMALLLMGGTTTYLVLPNGLDIVQGWPLLLTALGTAFVLTDLVTPSNQRRWLTGLILAIAGFAGLVVTSHLLEARIVATLGQFLPVALGILLLLLIIPIFRRSRN